MGWETVYERVRDNKVFNRFTTFQYICTFSLKTLNVSANRLTFVPPETLYNLSDVRELDLSHNELPGGKSYLWLNERRMEKVYRVTRQVDY